MEKVRVEVDEDIKSLIPDFLEGRRSDVETLPALIEKKDYKQIVKIGHGMRGSGGGYGFEEITIIGEGIESGGHAQDDDKILLMVSKLSDYLERVEVVYVSQ
jgi:hypothetical protein